MYLDAEISTGENSWFRGLCHQFAREIQLGGGLFVSINLNVATVSFTMYGRVRICFSNCMYTSWILNQHSSSEIVSIATCPLNNLTKVLHIDIDICLCQICKDINLYTTAINFVQSYWSVLLICQQKSQILVLYWRKNPNYCYDLRCDPNGWLALVSYRTRYGVILSRITPIIVRPHWCIVDTVSI